MITLYGMPLSNYFNKVKLALLHKGIEFKEVTVFPAQDNDFVKRTPLGKVPFIEVDGQFISESGAIIEYLEQAFSGPGLFPEDPLEAARCRQINNIIDMYFDAQIRRVLYSAFFGAPRDEKAIDEVAANLKKPARALQQIVRFKPFINSEKITIADYAAITTLPLCSACMTTLEREDPLAGIEGLEEYYQMMYELPDVKAIESARKEGTEAILKKDVK